MPNLKYFFGLLFASLFGGVVALVGYNYFVKEEPQQSIGAAQTMYLSKISNKSVEKSDDYVVPDGLNFMDAAGKVTPAVVHIKTYYNGFAGDYGRNSFDEMFKDFFGERPQDEYHDRGQKMSSGSGVIISNDGYIATNNHVIEYAQKIEVVLNDKRSFRAEVVGVDPTTDLALLKIDGIELPFVPYGNSDNVKPGQWVLAVGNPFDLTSTVTAGIVSAKTRNINILSSNPQDYSIESFIQTDAAVNPGNSGGALVDLNGKLIGINTAIATNTGSYAGYSFAVPVALVRKVMDDLLNFGEVQRALMGVTIRDVDAVFAYEYELEKVEGVYIDAVGRNSGAYDAGIEPGDVVLAINGKKVNNTSQLQEFVARNRPGDQILVTLKRKKETFEVAVTLKNKMNTTELIRANTELLIEVPELGAEVSTIPQKDRDLLDMDGGVKIRRLQEGRLKDSRVETGFIITHIDKQRIANPEELQDILANAKGELLLEGIYPDGQKVSYGIEF